MKYTELIRETLKEVIAEATKVTFKGHSFILKVGTNEDPNKQGVKVQFIPTEFGKLTKTERDDIAIELEKKLSDGLSQFEMTVERDRELRDKTIIGFFIYIEYFDRLIRSVLLNK